MAAGAALALAIDRRPGRSRLVPRLLIAGPLVIREFVLDLPERAVVPAAAIPSPDPAGKQPWFP